MKMVSIIRLPRLLPFRIVTTNDVPGDILTGTFDDSRSSYDNGCLELLSLSPSSLLDLPHFFTCFRLITLNVLFCQ